MRTADPPASGRAGLVIVAAVVAGAIGFVLTFLVARTIGAAASASFTAFWSGMYLVVGALAGVQQEVARSTLPAALGSARSSSLRPFTILAAVGVLVISAGIAAIWAGPVFGDRASQFVFPLAIGPTGYVVAAIASGALYGLHRWRAIAAMVVGDAALRFLAVAIVLTQTHDVLVVAWAVALPFGGTVAILWWFVRSAVLGRITSDVGLRRLTVNAMKTVVGALATSAVVSGLSLLVVATSAGADAARLGAFVFAVTVVRAPIMVGVMSAQSLLVVRFRHPIGGSRLAVRLGALVLCGGAVLAAIAALIGDPVLDVLAGPAFRIGPAALAVIVLSSALVGTLFISGPYAIATSRHGVYAAGSIAAALSTIAALVLPLDFTTRTTIALLVPPALGVAVHVLGLHIVGPVEPVSERAISAD